MFHSYFPQSSKGPFVSFISQAFKLRFPIGNQPVELNRLRAWRRPRERFDHLANSLRLLAISPRSGSRSGRARPVRLLPLLMRVALVRRHCRNALRPLRPGALTVVQLPIEFRYGARCFAVGPNRIMPIVALSRLSAMPGASPICHCQILARLAVALSGSTAFRLQVAGAIPFDDGGAAHGDLCRAAAPSAGLLPTAGASHGQFLVTCR
ncbi:hypothetical protein NKH16_11275 [Mesorhizobium sp. M1307]|uniref:hypothetical protein n=1 Tax=Mesorhizobium sp. M1307 TaxID=2957079 RepID=UPI0033363C4D